MTGFEKDYKRFEEINEFYDKAKENGDEAGMEKARVDYKSWTESIEAKGKDYTEIFRLYKIAKENGNDKLNISEPHETRDIPKLIENLKTFGITEFTFSSTWSGAIKSSWEFLQNGCELKGLIEIYNGMTKFMSEEKEKAPAYLFKIA